MMNAWRIPDLTGSGIKLERVDIPDQDLRPHEVVVHIKAIGVCFRDKLDSKGAYSFMPTPLITGV